MKHMIWENCYIYAIRHNTTGRIYIGCTKTDNRVETHFRNLKNGKHTNKAMQADCNEYGYKFTAYLLEILNRDKDRGTDPHEREAYWIHYYCTDDPNRGYNSDRWYTRIKITEFPKIKEVGGMKVKVE